MERKENVCATCLCALHGGPGQDEVEEEQRCPSLPQQGPQPHHLHPPPRLLARSALCVTRTPPRAHVLSLTLAVTRAVSKHRHIVAQLRSATY